MPGLCRGYPPGISIHAPRVGGDLSSPVPVRALRDFNPRPPCGGRHGKRVAKTDGKLFQSTPPVWGATAARRYGTFDRGISIHAPRVGGDTLFFEGDAIAEAFQSTPPVWGATERVVRRGSHGRISIHAPRVGGDFVAPRDNVRLTVISIHAPRVGGDERIVRGIFILLYFNPRPPCGGRPPLFSMRRLSRIFQSTPPVWGATLALLSVLRDRSISIHAPRVGGDSRRRGLLTGRLEFQSTPPVWGAT